MRCQGTVLSRETIQLFARCQSVVNEDQPVSEPFDTANGGTL